MQLDLVIEHVVMKLDKQGIMMKLRDIASAMMHMPGHMK